MIAPPSFHSIQNYVSHLGNVEFWSPYVAGILARHDLASAGGELVAGFNGTHPTFVANDVVVKLFGCYPSWRTIHTAERNALRLISTDPLIVAPRLLGEGQLFAESDAPWPYLVTSRIPGVALWRAALSHEGRVAIAVELGQQVRRIHALPPSDAVRQTTWLDLDVKAAAERSSLPPHLVAQVDDYLHRLEPFDGVFVNGDIVANHVYVQAGRLTGIIDWGDAIVTDPHYELIQIYRDTFDCDKSLFRAFLNAYGWPRDREFPRKVLSHAIRRQAIGLAQHPTIDVFEPISEKFPLHEIATLDDLAMELFAV